MLLRFALMVAAGYLVALVLPAVLGRTRHHHTVEACADHGGIWDAQQGVCHDAETSPDARYWYGGPDRRPK